MGAAPLMAAIEHARLITLYQNRAYAQVRADSQALIRRFESLGMIDKALRARLLRGRALKELGEWEEAIGWLEEVHAEAMRSGDLLVGALALCDRSEMLSGQGHFNDAIAACRDAIELASQSDCGWVVANVQGTLGELLRDRGDLHSSIDAYTASVRSYEELEMWPLAAYTRVVLAESMLLAGLPAKALSMVVAALPVIERENLTHEAVAAIGILREAIRRQQADPHALGQLREQLQRMRGEGGL
jgi:tetratricopeptide (TPR) repeat protein